MNHFLSIVMPCYKGESFIKNSIETMNKEVSLFEKYFELIVVVDGFMNDGYGKAKALEQDYETLRVVGYEKNRGKGYALQYGFNYSQGEYIAFLDSDLDYHPKALTWFLEIIKNNDADLVTGNRRDRKSTFNYPLSRKFASRAFNIYVNFLFPGLRIRDTQAGIKLIKRSAITRVFQCLNNQEITHGFIFDICILVCSRKLGLKIIEVPCIFEMRSSTIGTGRNFLKSAYNMAKEVWMFRKISKKLLFRRPF